MTIKSTVLSVILPLVGWVGILAGVNILSDEAPAALVLFPDQDFLAQMPEDISVLAATPFSVTVASEDAGLARELYRKGALLVLPAGLPGCVSRLKG